MSIFNSIPVVGKLIAENPWLKWAVIAFVAIFAVEFLGERAVDLYAKMATTQARVEQTKNEAAKSVAGLEVTAGEIFVDCRRKKELHAKLNGEAYDAKAIDKECRAKAGMKE